VKVEAVLRDPVVAQMILSELMEQLNAFIIEMRQGRASAERRFSAQQLSAAERDLRSAEQRQLQFLEQNRGSMSTAPALALEKDRIAREVDMRHQVFTSLAQAYEQARVDEYRSTPLITVLEAPERPSEPMPRRRLQWMISGMVIGVFLGFSLASIRQFLRDEWEAASTRASRDS
jgi:tyrosine-protein kinase Etk/Wzc